MPFVRTPDGQVIEVGNDALFTDPTASTPLNIPTGKVFTEEDIARARQEEKDKLYGRIDDLTNKITGLTEQVGGLTAEQQREKAAAEAEKKRLEEEARRAEEGNLDAATLVERRSQEWQQQLDQVNQSWTQKFEEAEQQRQAAAAALEKEREFNNLREYAQSQVAANQDKIAPQMLAFVKGNSQAEIDASITAAIEATEQIAREMQEAFGQQQGQGLIAPPAQTPVPVPQGVSPYSGPANSDPAGQFQQTLTAEQIANMPMDQYAKLRGQIGIGGQSNNRGLFG